MKKQILLSLSLLALAGSAAAQTGLYVTGDLAYGGLKTNNQKTNFGVENSEASKSVYAKPTGHVGLGYLVGQDALTFGGELGYTKFDNNSYDAKFSTKDGDNVTVSTANLSVKRQDLEVLGVVNYDVNSELNLFSKAGFVQANQKATFKKTGDAFSGANGHVKVSEFAPKLLVGAGYNLSKELTATVSYAHTFGNSLSNKFDRNDLDRLSSSNLYNVGLTYHFA